MDINVLFCEPQEEKRQFRYMPECCMMSMTDGHEDRQGYCYGCVFCRSGAEETVTRNMARLWPDAKSCCARIVKRFSENGKKVLKEKIAIPGYVFFRAEDDFIPVSQPGTEWRTLFANDDWRLHGRDRQFAEWLFENGGTIGLSHVYEVGDRIHIYQGPLKDLEGYIIRIDRRNKSGQVEIGIGDRKIRMWLGFEILEND